MEEAGLRVLEKASIIETKAWGKTDQGDFLNTVVKVSSLKIPMTFSTSCKKLKLT